MPTEEKPDFAKAYAKANEILVKSRVISAFPFSPMELVKEQTTFACRTYEKAMKHGVCIKDFGSESAVIIEMCGKTIIFYDETKPAEHICFSIIHELGHPLLNHTYSPISADEYKRYEIETNSFAAQLLMPEQLIRKLQSRGAEITTRFLQNNFRVSESAAEKRIATLSKTNAEWRSRSEREYDDIILLKYAAFLDRISPHKAIYNFDDELEMQHRRDSWY